MRRSAIAVISLMCLAACGGSADPTATQGGPNAVINPLLPVVATSKGPLRLSTMDGTSVGEQAVGGNVAMVAAGSLLIVLDPLGGKLFAMGRDGKVTILAAVSPTARGLVASPDGTAWMWAETLPVDPVTPHTYATKLFVGGTTSAGHQVTIHLETDHWLVPVAWIARGVIAAHVPIPAPPVAAFPEALAGPTSLVDPATGKEGEAITSTACSFGAARADGAFLCIPRGGAPGRVRWVNANGTIKDFTLPTAADAGDLRFLSGGNGAVLATVPSLATAPYSYAAYRLDFSSGAATRYGTGVLRPIAVLSDGRIVATGPAATSGLAPVFVITADGTSSKMTDAYQVGPPIV